MWLLSFFGLGRRKRKIPPKLRLKATMTYQCIKRDFETKKQRNQNSKIIITELPKNIDKKTAPDTNTIKDQRR